MSIHDFDSRSSLTHFHLGHIRSSSVVPVPVNQCFSGFVSQDVRAKLHQGH